MNATFMKSVNFTHQKILLIFAILFLVKCESIYFENPQPTDIKNKYRFPNKFIGTWVNESDTIFISKDYVYWINEIYPFEVLKTEIDTSTQYLIKNDKIYIINKNEEINLSQGVPFLEKKDTLFFKQNELNEIALGHTNFIRKIGDKYILNQQDKSKWFSLILFYKNNQNQLVVRGLNKKDLAKINQENLIYKLRQGESYQLFTNQEWSKAALLNFIKQGGFSDTIFLLELDKTKNHKINY